MVFEEAEGFENIDFVAILELSSVLDGIFICVTELLSFTPGFKPPASQVVKPSNDIMDDSAASW